MVRIVPFLKKYKKICKCWVVGGAQFKLTHNLTFLQKAGREGGSVDERGKENMRYEAQFASVCNCLVPTYLPTYLPYYNDQDGQIKRKKKTFLLNLSIVSTTANLIGFTA